MDLKTGCTLCPVSCGAKRNEGETGFCKAKSLKIARAALHFYEEPPISLEKGSGTVFFSGCPLSCVFCQNQNISQNGFGKEISISRLSEIFFELKSKGAHNINLVSPTPYVYEIIEALSLAKQKGLDVPIILNTSGYEKVSTIKLLAPYIDVYLPDFKYYNDDLALKYSKVKNYRETAVKALDEMVKSAPKCEFSDDGLITKGVIVRHLILPGHTDDSKAVLKLLHDRYGDKIYISIMRQYTPFGDLSDYKELDRTITDAEYNEVTDYAILLGIEQGFLQEKESASDSFIPPFDLTGV